MSLRTYKLLISDPGFSNFSSFFKTHSNHNIFIHRNFDFNSLLFRFFLFLKISNLFILFNTFYLILKSKIYKVDKVIIIKGSSINFNILDNFSIIYIVYLWDSINNLRNGSTFVNNPKNVFSFDSSDCENFKFKYVPLFHFRAKNPKIIERKIISSNLKKVSMYGSFSVDRVIFLSKNNLNNNIDFFITISFIDFIKTVLLTNISFKKLFKYTTFKKLSRKKIEFLLTNYLFTFDLSNTKQLGITTRTFESLSYSTPIITNNINTYNLFSEIGLKAILFDFKDPFDFSILDSFSNDRFYVSSDILNKYSINSFINKLL